MQADVFGRCCIQHKEGGMTLPLAPLPAASWNAVYALAAGSGGERSDRGALRIYETRGSNMYMDASNWGYRPPFGHGHHLWKPVTGQIALFPASCSYEIAPLRGVGEQVLILARLRFKAADGERQV
jgi:hypothetical protein